MHYFIVDGTVKCLGTTVRPAFRGNSTVIVGLAPVVRSPSGHSPRFDFLKPRTIARLTMGSPKPGLGPAYCYFCGFHA